MEDFFDKIINAIVMPIVDFIGKILVTIFSNNWLAITFWVLLINITGFILMKRDKEYAKEDKKRISEKTLLMTALVGGSIGIYAGMYKFRHKTLHKKFTILVPIIIVIQIAFIIYKVISKIFT